MNMVSNSMFEGDVLNERCPSRPMLTHITSQWGVLILMVLRDGTHRFSELRRKIGGISEKMLAQTLKILEEDRVVKRIEHPVMPPHVDYELTDAGHEVSAHIYTLIRWIEGHAVQKDMK